MSKPIAIQRRNGDRVAFRSRLEARWALYFDALGFDWKYEPFRFPIGQGNTYTPDFEVEGIGIIEVKPTWDALAESVIRIAEYVDQTKKRVLLLYGSSPVCSHVAILHGSPLDAYFPDRMQVALLLGGRQRWELAKQDYDALDISVFRTLANVSDMKLSGDALTPSEIILLNDTRDHATAQKVRGAVLLRQIFAKQTKAKVPRTFRDVAQIAKPDHPAPMQGGS